MATGCPEGRDHACAGGRHIRQVRGGGVRECVGLKGVGGVEPPGQLRGGSSRARSLGGRVEPHKRWGRGPGGGEDLPDSDGDSARLRISLT